MIQDFLDETGTGLCFSINKDYFGVDYYINNYHVAAVQADYCKVGNVHNNPYFQSYLYISTIFVNEKNRGNNLGEYIMNKFFELLNKQDFSKDIPIILNAIPSADSKMNVNQLIKWYDKFGFTLVKGTENLLIKQQ